MIKKGKYLSSILLRPDATLKEAMLKMNKTSYKIIFIASKNFKLLGTLTDGDIRRSLAEGVLPSSKIANFYNKNYHYLTKKNNNDQNIKKLFVQKKIFSIPLLNNKKIIGFYDIRDFLNISNKNTIILLMAGGYGKRLMPLTKNTPKPMLLIKGKPILQIMIEKLRTQGFKNIYISTHYKSNSIKSFFGKGEKFGVNISYLYEKKPMGTAGSLKHFKKFNKNKNLILINADILTNLNFNNILDFHLSHNSDLTMAIKNTDVTNEFGVVKGDGIFFKNLEEKPITTVNINAGIYVLNTKVIKNIKFKKKIDMVNFITNIKKTKKKVIVYPLHENWTDIGTISVYQKYK